VRNVTVIKIGGGAGIDVAPLVDEVSALVRAGERIVLVHGGSHETNELAERLGHPAQFITSPSGHSSRRTDRRTLEIFEMAYCGKINKGIVERFQAHGVNAIGLSGIDGGLWRGQRKNAIRAVEDGRTIVIRDDLSGRVERVNTYLLQALLGRGMLPVLCPPAMSDEGVAINVDADRAAAATAAALRARELLLLSNVSGVLRDPADPSSLIERADDLDEVRGAAKGRMKNKVLAAEEALQGGVGRVVIGSAQGVDAVARARGGAGTVFREVVTC